MLFVRAVSAATHRYLYIDTVRAVSAATHRYLYIDTVRAVSAATHRYLYIYNEIINVSAFSQLFYMIFLDPFCSSLRLPVPLTFCLVQSISWLSLLSLSLPLPLPLSLCAINSSHCRSLPLSLTFVFDCLLLSI